jgi:hypothetical protein
VSNGRGSCTHAGAVAAAAFVERGVTRLGVAVAKYVAEYGDVCFQTYSAIAAKLTRPGGGRYHRESIGRVCRQLARAGLMGSKRIMPFHKPRRAKRVTPHGTCEKWINWRALGISNPLSRSERRQVAQLQNRPATPPQLRPRHSVAISEALLDAKRLRQAADEAAAIYGPSFRELDRLMDIKHDRDEGITAPPGRAGRGPPE